MCSLLRFQHHLDTVSRRANCPARQRSLLSQDIGRRAGKYACIQYHVSFLILHREDLISNGDVHLS